MQTVMKRIPEDVRQIISRSTTTGNVLVLPAPRTPQAAETTLRCPQPGVLHTGSRARQAARSASHPRVT